MSVVVVQPDADHRHGRVGGGQELRIGVCGTVVRDLEHVRPQVRTRVEQRALGIDLGITRQQDADTGHLGTQDQRRVVRVRMRPVERRGRTQHVEVHGADVELRAHRRAEHR
jgi:hypothetical protein